MSEPARATLSEVARRAGVGRSSAARVLGGYGSVSAYTRERVLAAAAELGYEPNELARSMSTGVTMTIGVVVADIANPFFAGLLRGIADTARASGYGTLLVNTDEDPVREDEAIRLLVGKQVDGIVVAPAGGAQAAGEALRAAHARGIPIVQVDRTLHGLDTDAVVMDNRDAARESTEHLLALGHRRIGLAWGPSLDHVGPADVEELRRRAVTTEISSVGERFLGYLEALEAAGVPLDPDLIMTGEQTPAGVRAFVRDTLRRDPPTAIIATELDAVVGVLGELDDHGLRVPDDVSLIGFDASAWAEVFHPPITTVVQPVAELGARAAERLIARITAPDALSSVVHLASELVERGSVTAAR